MAESGVHLNINTKALRYPQKGTSLIVTKNLDSNVLITKLFPGIHQETIQTLFAIPNLKGIVLETYGSGNAPSEEWFIKLLYDAIKRGLQIVNVTQCSGGSVSMGHYETSTLLKKIGIISGKDITTEAAITKLMYLLGQSIENKNFKSIFETSLRGEIEN